MTRTLSITLQESNYEGLKQFVGSRKISAFIDKLVAENLEKKQKELIVAYQSSAKSKALKKEAEI